MTPKLVRWLDSFLPVAIGDNPDTIRKHKLFIIISFIISLFAISYGLMSEFIGFDMGIYAMIVSAIFFFLLPFLLKAGVGLIQLGILFGIYVTLLNALLVAYSGGLFVSPVTPFIVLTPVLSLIFCNRKTAIFFVIICVLYVVAFSLFRTEVKKIPITYNPEYHQLFLTLALAGLVIILFLVTNTFEQTKNSALDRLVSKQKELEHEQERSEKLLLNILPQATVNELKETGTSVPQRYELVTVMFADFVSFTKISETLPAVDLVKLIDYYYSAFDNIIGKYKIEKIKTIGDSYMCVSGISDQLTHDTAHQMVEASFEILAFIQQEKINRTAAATPYFNVRIGINSGPVVAGVVGLKKFAYDIWGDTVNTAARMQQHSDEGRINVSGSTYELIKTEHSCTYRGQVAAKNKGNVDMYFVEPTKQ